jgi:hypothetical protein
MRCFATQRRYSLVDVEFIIEIASAGLRNSFAGRPFAFTTTTATATAARPPCSVSVGFALGILIPFGEIEIVEMRVFDFRPNCWSRFGLEERFLRPYSLTTRNIAFFTSAVGRTRTFTVTISVTGRRRRAIGLRATSLGSSRAFDDRGTLGFDDTRTLDAWLRTRTFDPGRLDWNRRCFLDWGPISRPFAITRRHAFAIRASAANGVAATTTSRLGTIAEAWLRSNRFPKRRLGRRRCGRQIGVGQNVRTRIRTTRPRARRTTTRSTISVAIQIAISVAGWRQLAGWLLNRCRRWRWRRYASSWHFVIERRACRWRCPSASLGNGVDRRTGRRHLSTLTVRAARRQVGLIRIGWRTRNSGTGRLFDRGQRTRWRLRSTRSWHGRRCI